MLFIAMCCKVVQIVLISALAFATIRDGGGDEEGVVVVFALVAMLVTITGIELKPSDNIVHSTNQRPFRLRVNRP
jgi:hypothetical protein